jgi:hypothetical protein
VEQRFVIAQLADTGSDWPMTARLVRGRPEAGA